jgi:hypothetical protein
MIPSDLLSLPAGTIIRSGTQLATLQSSGISRKGTVTRYATADGKSIQLTPENCTRWVTLSEPS